MIGVYHGVQLFVVVVEMGAWELFAQTGLELWPSGFPPPK
jgi:hypothetical protein